MRIAPLLLLTLGLAACEEEPTANDPLPETWQLTSEPTATACEEAQGLGLYLGQLDNYDDDTFFFTATISGDLPGYEGQRLDWTCSLSGDAFNCGKAEPSSHPFRLQGTFAADHQRFDATLGDVYHGDCELEFTVLGTANDG